MADFVLTEEAKEDLWRIYNFGVEQFGETQAEKYFAMMYGCFRKIAKFPLLFSVTVKRNIHLRFCVCGVDTIYYQIHKNQVRVLTIIGRQHFKVL
jgi:toxin ParE1/3/4